MILFHYYSLVQEKTRWLSELLKCTRGYKLTLNFFPLILLILFFCFYHVLNKLSFRMLLISKIANSVFVTVRFV